MWLKGFGQDASGELCVLASTNLGPTGSTGTVFELVPEPSSVLLLSLACLLVLLRRPGPSAPWELARKTPNSPRSVIVPPLVTASRCAPGRPVSWSLVRSHTIRGRSSANSSLGYRPASMSRVANRAESGRAANGAARRMTAAMSDTDQSSIASIATSTDSPTNWAMS